jgi:hypothetical protein
MSVTEGSRRKQRTPGQSKGRNDRPRTTPGADKRKTETLRRGAISVFILFHLIAITCVAVPADFSPIKNVGELVGPYMLWTGLFQRWDMFAPDPPTVNTYVKTVVISRDRHMQVWSFPRMEELGFGERYRKERYRKFLEVLPQQQNASLWPDVARHVAMQFSSQTDPPDKVLLIEFQSDIHLGAEGSPAPRPNIFYEDYLQPGEPQ